VTATMQDATAALALLESRARVCRIIVKAVMG
jgi:hypothetical protein